MKLTEEDYESAHIMHEGKRKKPKEKPIKVLLQDPILKWWCKANNTVLNHQPVYCSSEDRPEYHGDCCLVAIYPIQNKKDG